MATDLERAYKALANKGPGYDKLWSYYDGDQPLVYSRERLEETFRDLNARFSQNWCSVVVDAAADRLSLTGFSVANNEPATKLLNDLWAATELDLDENDAHLAALVCGESYVIVWPDEDGTIGAYYNDPRMCHVFYQADNPRLVRYAVKWWNGDDERRYLTLYYADRLEYYVSKGKSENVQAANAFVPAEPPTAPNPFGQVPVFHFRRERRAIRSELANALQPQDAVNKLLADMMVAAEFGAYRQRWIISNADDDGSLKNAPNALWFIPSGDGAGQATSVGEFSQTDLGVYLNAMDKLATSIAIITRTPKHYLYAQGGDPSGEALIAMEAGLTAKCKQYVERFSAVWCKVAVFLLQLSGVTVESLDVTPMFASVETVQPLTKSIIRQNAVSSGIPLLTQLRDEGWTETELAEMAADKAAEQTRQANSLALAMIQQQRNFDRGQTSQGQEEQT